ncbi:MAG: hypothetical protein GQ531_06415 [Sulfurovum sp.]|nr:hypothetical protein [Sulfurovum sp.]
MKLKKIVSLSLLALALSACGGGGSDSASSVGLSNSEKIFVHNLFLDEYLWNTQVAEQIDYGDYSTRQGLIDGLKVTPPDIWSFTITAQEYENFANQKTAGFGFAYASDFTLSLVRIDAPAYEKLFRGDKLLQVNGEAVTQENISAAASNLNNPTSFKLLRNGSEVTVVVTPSEYSFKVSLGKVIDHNGKKVAYLRYDSFTESSVEEFEAIFTTFKNANVDELVIDMRYNGGGSILTASLLLDNITDAYPEQRQVYLDWNDDLKSNNNTYTFSDLDLQDGNELTMPRVFFLTTSNSASASELVISALTPYLGKSNVITVGEATHGKPVGMTGRTYGENFYFLVNFLVRNNAEETTSFEGIPVTCAAEDDITKRMGDPEEKMFATALYYIDNTSCP